MPVKPIPDRYHTVTPYLIVDNAAKAIDYYRKAFGAEERMRFEHGGKIGHAEIQIGDSAIMLGDEVPEMGYRSAKAIGATPVSIHLYVTDVDGVFAQAIAAGGAVQRPVKDEFYGDRAGTLTDPFGHVWTVSTHKEDLTPDELNRRAREAMEAIGST